uniref:BACK domain-containing protein n=1 Tax=Oncorhynchus kisutch TaxID=8019 RepID=A0A8C7MY31_ONCKI
MIHFMRLRPLTYIHTHISVTKEVEFFSLSHCQLLELISMDLIYILYTWVRWDVESRAPYLHALLNALHVYTLPPKFIKIQLQSCPILSKANFCRDFLSKIFQEMALRKPLPPAPHRGTQLIYIAGGYRQHSLSSLEAYDPGRNVWLKLADMGSPCSGLGSCVLFGLLHTVGGRNLSLQNNSESSSLCCYKPMTNQWSQHASLNTPRNRVGVAVVDGSIYAVGGSQGSTHHRTEERYDPEANCWVFVSPVSVARLGAGVAGCGGSLYVVVGGVVDGQNRRNTAERFHTDSNTWHQLAPMTTVRSGVCVVCVDSYLYAVGGYDGHTQLSSMERYSVTRDVWEPVASMQCSRGSPSTRDASSYWVSLEKPAIFLESGFSSTGFLFSVESYLPDTRRSRMAITVTMEPCPGNLPEEEEEEEVTELERGDMTHHNSFYI